MSGPKFLGFDTLALHAGQQPDRETGARATPIYQTTSFVFDDSDKASSLFDVARAGHVYSRISNPTVAVLEERVAALEGGVGAVCTASGMAAIHLGLTTITGAGGHIVASRALYGGTHNLLSYTLPRFGIETTFVDPQDPEAFAAAIRPETRVIFAETVANPRCEVLDIPKVSAIAHAAGVPLMIDATLTTPYLMQVLRLGADIVMHSLTKFMGGHGVALGGVLVDGGRFDWEASGRFPELSEPYAGFHGMDFVEEFGPAAYIMRARKEGLRDFGASLSPGNAFHLLQGLETLPMRMDRHVSNTSAIVKYLAEQAAVSIVHHPDRPEHADHELAKTLLPKGAGAVFSFELAGGRPAGSAFIESLQLFSHLANVGDAKSLVIHPASTTHSRMDDADLIAAGISPGLVRLSVGLEDLDDLLADLAQALRRAEKAAANHAAKTSQANAGSAS
ncbi:O-acetylhomoserine aminocarboxypropyltransferase [Granulosicoccus antarcticus]|uniref:L-methionine gamma-lyase n=1 Tax=Granulosicoccus antarcticus IMCC3135 TaxID=1192854 RepID=A0A2Z2NXI5_9GAMM|nr:O-acetylhomoserine aminocarboxypropyltransferase [Granulosicoccus antarcticus]ASJ75973.1 L-methionine gamma-lyase [Granulosicoccus antarcticus IMCC3135]